MFTPSAEELHVRLYKMGAEHNMLPENFRNFYKKYPPLVELTASKLKTQLAREKVHFNAVVADNSIEELVLKNAYGAEDSGLDILQPSYKKWAYDGKKRSIVWFSLARARMHFESTNLGRFIHERPAYQSVVMAAFVVDLTMGEGAIDEPAGLDVLALYRGEQLEDMPRENSVW